MQNLMGPESNGKLEPDLIKHMILNSIRSYLAKYGNRYGKLIVCCDSRSYWRKDIFPYYKEGRKKARDDSDIDWNMIFSLINEMKLALKEYFPYPVVEVIGAEADDIIAVLTKEYHTQEEILIVSGDKDYAQLQKYKNVYQYAPVQKNEIKIDNPKTFLMKHIIQGDKGDGIPNFLSVDNSFVDNIRQKSIMKAKLAIWLTQDKDIICETEDMKKNWERNEKLINFDYIPLDISNDIKKEFSNSKENIKSPQDIYNYMTASKMRQLINYIDDFSIGQRKNNDKLSEFFS